MSKTVANALTGKTPEGFKAPEKLIQLLPGMIFSGLIAFGCIFVGARIGGPAMLYALLAGIGLYSVASHSSFQTGVKFSANTVLKIGVALLGVRMTLVDIAGLGVQTVALVIGAVALTLTAGWAIGRALGLKSDSAIVTAGAVAICGSSAALAISATLPKNETSDCNTVMAIITVTLLSTLAMVLYPLIVALLGLSDVAAGVFMGTSIHNVAQVVGAGFIVSDEAGDVATIVKLMRVALLLPVIIVISMLSRGRDVGVTPTKKPPILPLFMIGFIAVMLMNSFGFIPVEAAASISKVSHFFLVTAVVAIGMRTSLKDIVRVGPTPIMVMVLQTAMLAAFVLIALSFVLTL